MLIINFDIYYKSIKTAIKTKDLRHKRAKYFLSHKQKNFKSIFLRIISDLNGDLKKMFSKSATFKKKYFQKNHKRGFKKKKNICEMSEAWIKQKYYLQGPKKP